MPSKISSIQIPDSVFRIPKNYSGLVIVSDVDKTYLDTQIHSIRGLLKAAFERPERKTNVPGFSVLLRALRRGASENPEKNPLFFLSASPPQIGPSLRAKMDLDGIEHEGLILKNQLRHIQSGDFKKLREQLGYKLGALLSLWYYLPKTSKLVLFGDDSESDAIAFTLFSLVASAQLYGKELAQLLQHLGVFRQEAMEVAWLSRRFVQDPKCPLQATFINLDLNLRPLAYIKMAPFFYPTENSLQAAAVAYENKLIRMKAVVSVAREMLLRYDWNPEQMGRTLIEGCRRLLFAKTTLLEVGGALLGADVFTSSIETMPGFADLDFSAKGYLAREWAARPPERSIVDWKKLFNFQSL